MLRRSVRLLGCRELFSSLRSMKLYTSASKVLYSSFDKDLPNPSLPTPFKKTMGTDTDILLEQLQMAQSVHRVLELSSMHLDVMNANHIVESIKVIHNLAKIENTQLSDLTNSPIFQGICSRLMKIVRFLDAQQLISIFKCMSFLGVHNNTYVMQALLKMIGSHLNDMSLGQLTFLSFLLSKQKHSSLVDGLKLALPLVLQVQIEQQLNSDNVTEIVDCLQLACRARLKPATTQKVLNAVLDKAKSLSPTNATTVAFALLNLETPVNGYKELINYSFEVMSKNIEQLDEKKIIFILRMCCSQNFYHSRFKFAVADKIVAEKWSLLNTWEAVRQLHRMGFSPPNLMDHLVNAISLESDVFRTSPTFCPLQCIEYLTATGYQPERFEEVVQILCSCENKIQDLSNMSLFLLMKFISCLAMFGYFPEKLVTEVLQEELLCNAWSKSRKIGRGLEFERSLFSLAWSLELYDQQQKFSVPPGILKNLLHNAQERFSEYACPLQKFIENGLGGSQFLKSGIFTRDGMLVDHVVAMRSGNFPVSIQSNSDQPLQCSIFVEDISLPADAKIVAIIVAHEDKYCRDPEVLKGWMDLKIRCLAKKKFSPVIINYSNWRDLPDREKIPYLMQVIKNAIQVDSISSINSSF